MALSTGGKIAVAGGVIVGGGLVIYGLYRVVKWWAGSRAAVDAAAAAGGAVATEPVRPPGSGPAPAPPVKRDAVGAGATRPADSRVLSIQKEALSGSTAASIAGGGGGVRSGWLPL